jgi:Beta-propeller repeat
LPLSFEANHGQTDPQVKFLSRGPGYALFLTTTDAVLSLNCGNGQGAERAVMPVSATSQAASSKSAVLRIRLVHANRNTQLSGTDELAGRSNYFIGNDPAKWRRDIPTFGKVKYRGVYPGVDLVYYGDHRQLEYDFVLAPGVDPSQIELRFEGAKGLRLDRNGNLIVSIAGGNVVEHTPVIYQDVAGVRRRIAGGYQITDAYSVGFKLARYDHGKSLTIDPSLVYSTYLGGSGYEQGFGIAVDASGNAYVTGFTESANFPFTAGAFQTTLGGTEDAFVTKLNPTGSGLVYSTYLGGGGGSDDGEGISVDASGNAYVTGRTFSTNFPTTAGAVQTTFGGSEDAFVTKLNPTGSGLLYSTYLGGSGFDGAFGIAVDGTGNAYVTGFASANFPTTAGAFQTTRGGLEDAFVAKLNPTGSGLVYSTYLGGSGSDVGARIALDTAGNAYVTGVTGSTNFPTMPGAFRTTSGGGPDDAFVTKLNPTGSGLVYSTYLGGSVNDEGDGIAVDTAGNAYVTGETASTDFPITAGAFQTTFGGGPFDAFVTKLNPTGSGLVYSTFLGGGADDVGIGLSIDAGANAYVTGYTESANFPTIAGALQTTSGGGRDAFVTKLNPTGSGLLYSTYLGGSGSDEGEAIAVDTMSNPNVYVTGDTNSSDFPTTAGAFQTTFGGVNDAFVSKLSLATASTCAFASFTGKVDIVVSTGYFDVTSSFTLGTGCSAINPLTQNVTFQIYTYSVTVPAGSFTKKNGSYVF